MTASGLKCEVCLVHCGLNVKEGGFRINFVSDLMDVID